MPSKRFQQQWLVFRTQQKEDSTIRWGVLRCSSNASQTTVGEANSATALMNSYHRRICSNISSLAQICHEEIEMQRVVRSRDNILGRMKAHLM